MEVVGCLSEVIGLVRIHCRIQWDPRVGFFVLGKFLSRQSAANFGSFTFEIRSHVHQ